MAETLPGPRGRGRLARPWQRRDRRRSRSRAPRRWPNSGTGASAGGEVHPEDAGPSGARFPRHPRRHAGPERRGAARAAGGRRRAPSRDAGSAERRRPRWWWRIACHTCATGSRSRVEASTAGAGETRAVETLARITSAGELKGEGDGDDPRQDQGIQARRDRGGQGRGDRSPPWRPTRATRPAFGPSRRPS